MKAPLLVNAREMARHHPDTFSRPEPWEIARLGVGDFAKVSDDYERFWVRIISRNGDLFVGRIDNFLYVSQLRLNDRIEFHVDNIYDLTFGH